MNKKSSDMKEQFSAMSKGSFAFKKTGGNPPEDVIVMANMSHYFFFANLMITKDMINGYLISLPKDLVEVIAIRFLIKSPEDFTQDQLIDKIIDNVYI